jgi:hypothetical protein
MNKILVPLIIEKRFDNEVFGQINYENNLIVESSTTIDELLKKFEHLLKSFHQLKADEIDFDIQYI